MKTQALATIVLLAIATLASPPGRGDGETGTKLSPVPPVLGISVEPLVAPPGVKRTIHVSGFSTDACVPTEARIGRGRQTLDVAVLLTVPPATAVCAQAFATWSFALEFTPDMAGNRDILVMTTEPGALGRGMLVTSYATAVRSKFNINGAWYDPATNGSGLTFDHRYAGSDTVFATWQIYDANGDPRWLSLQQTRWTGDGSVLEGTIYGTKSSPSYCATCPSVFTQVEALGEARITFAIVNGRLTGAFDSMHEGGTRRVADIVPLLTY